jgi:hypothetical protein
MRIEQAFNPLDKKNLGTSVADALLARDRASLPPGERFVAAGVYALYYMGDFEPYRPLAERNRANDGRDVPIYVGKAIPKGARKGGFGLDASPGTVLSERLSEHSESIRLASNLKLEDFFCRYLAVDDIWIPLGENLLIEMFSPLWNRVVDGFGNHDPGRGRHQGRMPAWDVLHPGREWANRLQPGKQAPAILHSVAEYFDRHTF